LKVQEELVGRRVKCPNCGTPVRVVAEEPDVSDLLEEAEPEVSPPPAPRTPAAKTPAKGRSPTKRPPLEETVDEIEPAEGSAPAGDTDAVEEPASKKELNWFDRQFLNTNVIFLLLLSLCCAGLAVPFGFLGMVGCRSPKARKRAILVFLLGLLWAGLAVLGGLFQSLGSGQ
jgi:hypothetical protein